MTVSINENGVRLYFSGKIPAFGINMVYLTALNIFLLRYYFKKDHRSSLKMKEKILAVKGIPDKKIKLVFIEALAAAAFAYSNGGKL